MGKMLVGREGLSPMCSVFQVGAVKIWETGCEDRIMSALIIFIPLIISGNCDIKASPFTRFRVIARISVFGQLV